MSTSQSDLKKLAKILVATDPGIFPLLENPFKSNHTAPEICAIARRMKKSPKTTVNNINICASVTVCLTCFAFLNNLQTATASDHLFNII